LSCPCSSPLSSIHQLSVVSRGWAGLAGIYVVKGPNLSMDG
jgi:hypothetical protein